MSQTVISYGSNQDVRIFSAMLFAMNMQRPTGIGRMAGKMERQADAEGNIRMVSTNRKPVIRVQELTKTAGDEVSFDLVNPMKAVPIMGGAWAEGKGAKMTFSNDKLRLNQARIPISAGDTMSQQRTRHTLRSLAKAQAESIMLRFSDQAELVHLAGARGFDDNIEWTIPLASDPRFADVMVNTVRAPTRNRHFRASAGTITPMAASAGNITISSTDVMNTDVVDSLATLLERMPLPPPGVQFENDQMANDSPVRVLLVSAEQYTSFLQSTNFRTLQANAMARAQMAKNHPVFMGDALLWRGILILKMPKPIRFFASNALNWCPSTTSNAETTTDIVPAAFSTTYAVDRAILLGGQALAEGFGKAMQSGASFFWSEKELDHGDKMEYLIGEVAGRSKIQFLVDFGDTQQYTDYGVIAIDTAVRLAGI